MPGPPVAVCQHDIVVLDVVNEEATETTSIHFHGKQQNRITHFLIGTIFLVI